MGRPSPAFRMPRLASPFEALRPHYDALVVGSGYGGGIAAARLARAGMRVAVLERGRERHPGEYPSRLRDAARSMQLHVWGRRIIGRQTALFDVRGGDGLSALVGCGLGGTSLINANVCLEVDDWVWRDACWPKALIADMPQMDAGVQRAREMLGANPFPDPPSTLQKVWQLEREGLALGQAKFRLPDLAISFVSSRNSAGVDQGACRRCGDCVSGCNYGAKNTVLMNYLPYARKHGAEIFTELRVDAIERQGGRWLVRFWRVGTGQRLFDAPLRFVSADLVVLAAGTLGSTEILHRSKKRGLELSDQVGKRFSGNGDVLAFAYNCRAPVNGIGLGEERVADHHEVGPCIGGMIDLRAGEGAQGMVIQDGSPPGAIGKLVALLLFAVSQLGFLLHPPRNKRGRRDLGFWMKMLRPPWNPYDGAAHRTQTHLVMTHDASQGELKFERGRLRLSYPAVGNEEIFRLVDEKLARASEAIEGTHVRNPLWHPPPRNFLAKLWHRFRHRDRFRLWRPTVKPGSSQLVTVHPLGGCPMAEDAADGVVNDRHQVFSERAGARAYDSLYVMDGSVIPRSLGVNPLLTISGLAERACYHLLNAHGRQIRTDLDQPDFPPAERRSETLGLRFTESLVGRVRTLGDGDDPEMDYGRAASDPAAVDLDVILDMEIDDVDVLIASKEHQLRVSGVARSKAIFGPPAMVMRGSYAQILREDPDCANRRTMRYRLNVVTEDRRRYRIEGEKWVYDHILRFKKLWDETTILYTRVYEADAAWKPQRQIARGTIRVTVLGFLRQLTTYRAVNGQGLFDCFGALYRFFRFFCTQICQHSFPGFAPSNRVQRHAAPRKKRDLSVSAPVPYDFEAIDGKQLRLTRYCPPDAKAPVILSHGLGVSSRIFSIDTIEPNLVEYLYRSGYDVWLLDYRASIDLPHVCNSQFSADDIAKNDYPAALAFVLGQTGECRAHFLVHCFGATTFFMSALGGYLPPECVRSVVVSQVATHMITSLDTALKSGVHVGELLYYPLRQRFLDAYTDDGASRANRLLDYALRFLPIPGAEERCRSEVCHRISFIYSMLFEHDRLNRETHDALGEMFGAANMTALRHLGEMSRRGKLVDFEGEDVYIRHMRDRLRFPITFLYGAENYCFKPASTQITHALLEELRTRFPHEPRGPYKIRGIPGYGHIDFIFGRDAHRDVYPHVVDHLDQN